MYHIAQFLSCFYDSAQPAIKIQNYQLKSFEMNPGSSKVRKEIVKKVGKSEDLFLIV